MALADFDFPNKDMRRASCCAKVNHTAEPVRIFGKNVFNGTKADAVRRIFETGGKVYFLNAHNINVSYQDDAFSETLDRSDLLLPDGSGLALAAAFIGKRFVENLNGTDLFALICQAAAQEGASIYFFGGAPGVAQQAARTARRHAPALRIAGARHGFFRPDEEAGIVREINASGADIVLAALGTPKQEFWIDRSAPALAARAVIGVGGLFDFAAGRIPRAPAWIRRRGCEWLWRLAMEPRRLAGRYLIGNPLFVWRAARQALDMRRAQRPSGADRVKRALDIAVSALALTALAPLFALVALAIRLESKGPVFFTQTRVGQNGAPFRIWKFRSMRSDAERQRAALQAASDRQGVCFKARRDPRVTRIGALLRRWSIDEAPQLWNILIGDMSLVGPRPGLPAEVAAYSALARRRLEAKPGLTGLWQVSGRADVDFDRMIELDLAYARSRSLTLDLLLLALTVRTVLRGDGAY